MPQRIEVKCSKCDSSIAILQVANEKDRLHQLYRLGWRPKPVVCTDCLSK